MERLHEHAGDPHAGWLLLFAHGTAEDIEQARKSIDATCPGSQEYAIYYGGGLTTPPVWICSAQFSCMRRQALLPLPARMLSTALCTQTVENLKSPRVAAVFLLGPELAGLFETRKGSAFLCETKS